MLANRPDDDPQRIGYDVPRNQDGRVLKNTGTFSNCRLWRRVSIHKYPYVTARIKWHSKYLPLTDRAESCVIPVARQRDKHPANAVGVASDPACCCVRTTRARRDPKQRDVSEFGEQGTANKRLTMHRKVGRHVAWTSVIKPATWSVTEFAEGPPETAVSDSGK